jgi:hypothetical protein
MQGFCPAKTIKGFSEMIIHNHPVMIFKIGDTQISFHPIKMAGAHYTLPPSL